MTQVATSLTKKLFNVQQKVGSLVKDLNNPFFKSKYADLNQVLEVAKAALHEQGLFLSQGPDVDEFNNRFVKTAIIDSDSGQSIYCRVPFSGNEKNMQEIGAATTYGRRFGIVSLLALEQEDDDGETAVGRGANTKFGAVQQESKANDYKGTKQVLQSTSTEVPSAAIPKKTLIAKIKATGKLLISKKIIKEDEPAAMLSVYGVKSTEELNDDQAAQLLKNLEAKLA